MGPHCASQLCSTPVPRPPAPVAVGVVLCCNAGVAAASAPVPASVSGLIPPSAACASSRRCRPPPLAASAPRPGPDAAALRRGALGRPESGLRASWQRSCQGARDLSLSFAPRSVKGAAALSFWEGGNARAEEGEGEQGARAGGLEQQESEDEEGWEGAHLQDAAQVPRRHFLSGAAASLAGLAGPHVGHAMAEEYSESEESKSDGEKDDSESEESSEDVMESVVEEETEGSESVVEGTEGLESVVEEKEGSESVVEEAEGAEEGRTAGQEDAEAKESRSEVEGVEGPTEEAEGSGSVEDTDTPPPSPTPTTPSPAITSRVFLDISIDGAPAGRIVIGLYGKDVPLGASRFEALARGVRGVSYRRKEFTKLTPGLVQNAGLRSFSLTGSPADVAPVPGGTIADSLLPELQAATQDPRPELHNTALSVSLVVTDPSIPPPKQRLIARDGQLVTVEEEVRPPPNGTEFSILFEDAPDLDATNLVVGRVLEGESSTLESIKGVPYVKENTSSPYFRAAKLIGDTRAVVAERGFFRPYKKIVIQKCGILE